MFYARRWVGGVDLETISGNRGDDGGASDGGGDGDHVRVVVMVVMVIWIPHVSCFCVFFPLALAMPLSSDWTQSRTLFKAEPSLCAEVSPIITRVSTRMILCTHLLCLVCGTVTEAIHPRG